MKRVIIAALAIAAVVGCTKEESYTPESDSSDVVKFSSSQIDTRVSADGSKWSANESIGIAMANSDMTLATKNKNVQYTSTNSSEETSVDFAVGADATALLYPNTGNVTFYAYYPWSKDITASNEYEIDVTTQEGTIENPVNLDFMVAEPITTSRQDAAQEFTFSHKMAKITITITGNDNVSTVAGVTASALGLVTKRKYIVAGSTIGAASGDDSGKDKPIPFVMTYETPTVATDPIIKATATAIVHTESAPSATMTFTLPVEGESSREFKVALPTSGFVAGNNYCYEIALGNDVPTFSGSTITGWDGQPSSTIYSNEFINFEDEKFKEKLLSSYNSLDTNNDGEISYLEAYTFTPDTFEISGAGITSMAEIKYFPNITYLMCDGNDLTSLDLSANTKLTYLNCNDNDLTSLKFSADAKLSDLNCNSNKLSSLDLSKCTELGTLLCNSNDLSSLDLSANTKLTKLCCSSNSLTELKVSDFTELTSLECIDNSLTKLELPVTSTLTTLCCYANKLSTLDISECPNVGMNSGAFNDSYFLVGNQSNADGSAQTITVTVTKDQYNAMYNKLTATASGENNYNVEFINPNPSGN